MMIVDASVALKWFLPEAGSREAIALQSGPHNLAAPSLIRMEVAGAICRATRGHAPRISKVEANQICSRWFALLDQQILEIVADETLLKEACGLAVSLGHPLADCLYLQLAHRWNWSVMNMSKTGCFANA
jgi:predicted nucleic acid-binding protein